MYNTRRIYLANKTSSINLNKAILEKTIPSNEIIIKSIQKELDLISQISIDTVEPQTTLQGYSAATKAKPLNKKPIKKNGAIANLIRKYKINIEGLTTKDYEFKYPGNTNTISFSANDINRILGAITYFYQTVLMATDTTTQIEEEFVKQNQFLYEQSQEIFNATITLLRIITTKV